MIEIKQLLYFRTCVDEGSFSQAAERLYTTQPNVSKVIRSLEKDVGARLLHRNGRGVTPTDAGEKVLHYSKVILSTLQNMESVSDNDTVQLVRIASTYNRYITYKLAEFNMLNSDRSFHYDYWEGNLHHVIYRVENDNSSIGFLHLPEYNLPSFCDLMDRKNILFHTVNQGQEAIFIGPNNPYYNEEVITKEMLPHLRLIQRRESGYQPSSKSGLSPLSANNQKSAPPAFITNSSDMIEDLLKNTDFAHPSYTMDGWDLRLGPIRCLPVEGGDKLVFGYIQKKDYALSSHLTNFLSWL